MDMVCFTIAALFPRGVTPLFRNETRNSLDFINLIFLSERTSGVSFSLHMVFWGISISSGSASTCASPASSISIGIRVRNEVIWSVSSQRLPPSLRRGIVDTEWGAHIGVLPWFGGTACAIRPDHHGVEMRLSTEGNRS